MTSNAQDLARALGSITNTPEAVWTWLEQPLLGVGLVSRDGRWVAVNSTLCTMLGYDREELVGMTWQQLTPEDELEQELATYNEVVAGRGAVGFVEKRYRCKIGTIIHVEISAFRVGRDLDHFLALIKDETDRKRALEEKSAIEAQLQQAMKMEAIGRLAGGVAHDFNNLLTGISGHIELALLDVGPYDPVRVHLGEVQKAAERAAELTRQLLAFSRKQILAPRHIDLAVVIEGLRRMFARIIGEDIEMRTHLPTGVGTVDADPGQVEQVLVNLVVNARDSMPVGGVLELEVTRCELDASACHRLPPLRPGPHAVVTVRDTGVGMTDEAKAHLFEPFFSTKPLGKGTGLGLATVFGVIQQHRGAIEVESESGKGTAVRLFFPRTEGEAEPHVDARHASKMPTGTETILLVEDETIVRELMSNTTRRLGYQVLEAQNGNTALLIAEQYQGRIDLLLTDVVMPNLNGRELANRLKQLRPEMEILFTSGYSEEIIAREGILEPGLHFIAKPFRSSELAAVIRQVLEHRTR
jgi:two-component system, cell cycle sensor histidine kinase and response regulator CckA